MAHLPMLPYMNAHLEAMGVRAFSVRTIKTTDNQLRGFIAWCDERGLRQPADVSKQVLERYQRHLFYYRKEDGKPLTVSTQCGRLIAVKRWFRWLARENHILFNPASEIDLPRKTKTLPRAILSISEVESLLAMAAGDNPGSLRDRALMELMYSTAIRRLETANLAIYDLDFNRKILMVRQGKGGKDRVVPVGERALAWVDKYLLEARPLLLTCETQALFISDSGVGVTPCVVAHRVGRHKDRAGIKKPGEAHLLRHTCATHMLEGGADIRYVQEMLGHADLETTALYTRVSIDRLRAVHEATHPARLHRAEAGPGASPDDLEALRAILDADDDPDEKPLFSC